MSVELQEQRVRYVGNGTARNFPFQFTIEDESHVRVVQANAYGVEKDLTLGTDYTVSVLPDGTGSVTLSAPLTTGYVLALLSNIPSTQERTFLNNTPYYQEQIEGALDKNVRLIQQLAEIVGRAFMVPPTSIQTPTALVQEIFAVRMEAAQSAQVADQKAQEAAQSAQVADQKAQEAAQSAQVADQKAQEALDDIQSQTTFSLENIQNKYEGAILAIENATEEKTEETLERIGVEIVKAENFAADAAKSAEEAENNALMAKGLLPGMVIAFAANSDPEGYLLCNGAAVSRTTYKALFSAIGTTYGAGDGASTFNLPDLADRFIQGSGTAGTVKEAGLPDHKHYLNHTQSYYYSSYGPEAFYTANINREYGRYIDEGRGNMGNASASNAIYGKSTTVQPPALTMRFYIKY